MDELLHGDITETVLAAAFEVHSTLGPGMIESVYEQAMIHELRLRGMTVDRQVRYQVNYKGATVGEFFIDLLVNGQVIVELKATSAHQKVFELQTLYYLKASGIRVGLLLNFGMTSLFRKRFIN